MKSIHKIIITLLTLLIFALLIVLIDKIDNESYTQPKMTETSTADTTAETDSLTDRHTIVCFGDSIFGMYRGETSVSSYIAVATGDIVYNVGFGGCRMAEHPYTGYNEFCMYSLARAITENDFSLQENAAHSGSSYFPQQLELLKSIDFNTVDTIIIHYGVNDLFGGVAIGESSTNRDTSTFCGAMRYSLDTLIAAYPNIDIFISLPAFHYRTDDNGNIIYSDEYTNRNGNTVFDYISATEDIAAEYSLTVIDSYHGIGINRQNANKYLPDGIHHNANGRKRLGEYIAYRLLSEQREEIP